MLGEEERRPTLRSERPPQRFVVVIRVRAEAPSPCRRPNQLVERRHVAVGPDANGHPFANGATDMCANRAAHALQKLLLAPLKIDDDCRVPAALESARAQRPPAILQERRKMSHRW